MIKVKDNHLLDSKGNPIGIFVDIKEYRKLIKKAEELDAIKEYDEAKSKKQKAVPFEQAIKEIKQRRK